VCRERVKEEKEKEKEKERKGGRLGGETTPGGLALEREKVSC